MNGSHNWSHQLNTDPSGNNGQNLDWATMARQWVELQQKQQSPDATNQTHFNDAENVVGMSEGAQLAAPLNSNNLISPYQPLYNPYLQQQIMHQQILAAAQWAASNQTIYPSSSQYMLDGHISHLQPQQAQASHHQIHYPYNLNPSQGYALQNPSYLSHSTQPISNATLPLPTKTLTNNLASASNEINQSGTEIVDVQPTSDQSTLGQYDRKFSTDSSDISMPPTSGEIGHSSSVSKSKKNQIVAHDNVDHIEKPPLEPYRKKPIPAMTINKSSACQTSSKPVSKIPQWIREGLERIERERARKLEKERQEASFKNTDEDSLVDFKESQTTCSKLSPRESFEEDHSSDEADDDEFVRLQTPFIRDKESVNKDLAAILSSSRAHGSDGPAKKLPEILKEGLAYPNLRRFMDGTDDLEEEERNQMLNDILRQALTKLLLEETNHMIESTCSEMYEKFKKHSAVSKSSQTTSATSDGITAGTYLLQNDDANEKQKARPLGYLIDYDSGSSEDENTDDHVIAAVKSRMDKPGQLPSDRINSQKNQCFVIEPRSHGDNDTASKGGMSSKGDMSSKGKIAGDVYSEKNRMGHAIANDQMPSNKESHETHMSSGRDRRDSRRHSRSRRSRRRSRSRDRGPTPDGTDEGSRESKGRNCSRGDPRHSKHSRTHDRSPPRRHRQHHRHGKDRHGDRSRNHQRYSRSRRSSRDRS